MTQSHPPQRRRTPYFPRIKLLSRTPEMMNPLMSSSHVKWNEVRRRNTRKVIDTRIAIDTGKDIRAVKVTLIVPVKIRNTQKTRIGRRKKRRARIVRAIQVIKNIRVKARVRAVNIRLRVRRRVKVSLV